MVYITKPEEEEDKNKKKLATPSGEVLGTGTTPSGGISAPKKGAGGSSSPFQDISKYLAVNKSGAARLGQQLAGQVSTTGETARRAVSEGAQEFSQEVAGKTVAADPNILGQISSSPQSITSNPEKLAQAQRMRDALYQGPGSLAESNLYAPISKALEEAKTTREAAKTEAGQQTLLAQARPQTRGQVLLNQGLVGASPEARETVLGAAGALDPLESEIAQTLTQSQSQVEQAKAANQTTAQQTQDAIAASQKQFETGLENRLKTARTSAEAANAPLSQALTGLREPEPAMKDPMQLILDRPKGAKDFTYPYDQRLLELLGVSSGLDKYIRLRTPEALAAQLAKRSGNQAAQIAKGGGTGGGYDYLREPGRGVYGTPDAATLSALDVTPEQWKQITDALFEYENVGFSSKGGQQKKPIVNTDAALYGKEKKAARYTPATFAKELSQYIETAPSSQITREQVATPEDYTVLQALNLLAENESEYINNPELAGTAPTELSTLDLERLLADIAAGTGYQRTLVSPHFQNPDPRRV